MQIYFKRKNRGITQPSNDTISLVKFLLENKDYIEISMFIIGINDKASYIEKIKKRFKLYANQHGLKNKEKLDELLTHIINFYNTTDDDLSKRRGDLLEQIVQRIEPVHVKNEKYKQYAECYIYHGEDLIKHSDIDVVHESIDKKEAELIECKANLERFLKEKIPTKSRKKLDFMNEVKLISEEKELDYSLFLATCLSDDTMSKNVLQQQGYYKFEVLTSIDIIENLK